MREITTVKLVRYSLSDRTQTHIIGCFSYNNITKCWLTAILLFLPFQRRIIRDFIVPDSGMARVVSSLDEITIVVFFLLAVWEYFKSRRLPGIMYPVTFSILLMCVAILLSGMVNGNSLHITVLSTFDYMKNFLAIFIYAAFFKDNADFKKVFQLLLIIASIIGAVALIQEIWALTSRYLLQREFNEMGGYLIGRKEIGNISWRFGIYRARSLMSNSNIMGLYCLLIFTIYIFTAKKLNLTVFILILCGVLTSLSRMAYAGIILLGVIGLFRRDNRLMIAGGIAALFMIFSLSSVNDTNVSQIVTDPDKTNISFLNSDEEEEFFEKDNSFHFREYMRDKAITIWKDHPVWGVGGGKFGGRISLITHSQVYNEYNVFHREKLEKWGGIDQFWPQLLAELGIVGTALFALLFMTLFMTFRLFYKKENTYDEAKFLSEGLMVFILMFIIISTGSGINIAPVIFTYMAFIGILYGSCTT